MEIQTILTNSALESIGVLQIDVHLRETGTAIERLFE